MAPGKFILALALSLAILLTLGSVPASGTPDPAISVTAEEAVDGDGDGTYEYLALHLVVVAPSAGQYSILGSVKNSGGVRAINTGTYTAGANNVTLWFSGKEIYNRGLGGRLTISLRLASGPEVLASTEYLTGDYPIGYFNPDIPPEGTHDENLTLHLEENTVVISGSAFTARVKTDRPEVIYHYTGSEDTKFSVLFTRVVFYNDTNFNGRYEDGAVVASGDLSMARWTAVLDLVEGYSRFDFSVRGTMALAGGSVEIVFRYSSAMRTVNRYDRQKFDIDIRPEGIGARRVALLHTVSVLSGEATVSDLTKEGDEYCVSFYDGKNHRLGYYSFSAGASLYLEAGTSPKDIIVSGYTSGASYVIDYEYEPGMYIHHDPEIALDPAFAPKALAAVAERIRNDPRLFATAVLITGLLVGWNITSVKKKRSA